MKKYLIGGVSLFAIFSANNAIAAGYTCEELIEYTSCMPGYFLGTESCPENYSYSDNWYMDGPGYYDGTDTGVTEADCADDEGVEYSCSWYGSGCVHDDNIDCTDSRGCFITIPKISYCNDCPAGASCAGGTADKEMCAPGTYQPNTKQTSCIDAPMGSFVATSGAKKYSTCSAGTYQPNTGQTTCVACPAGSYCATSGLSTVTGQCEIGEYSFGGATACKSCPDTKLTDKDNNPVDAITASKGATSPSACFIDPNVYFKNDKGIYHFKQNCSHDAVDAYTSICADYKVAECQKALDKGWIESEEDCDYYIDCDSYSCDGGDGSLLYNPTTLQLTCKGFGVCGSQGGIDHVSAACENSGGTWNTNTLGCDCPSGYVFDCDGDAGEFDVICRPDPYEDEWSEE